MTNQRLRNITTGFLHTRMDDIYEDVEFITGEKGIMTHMLPNCCDAIRIWLKSKGLADKFFERKYDQDHKGETELVPMTDAERAEFWNNYQSMPDPLSKL